MPGNELTIQVGAELDLKGLSDQLNSITNKKDNKITFTTNKDINTQLDNLKKTINDISSKDHQINFHVDQRIFNDLQSIVDGLNNGLTQIGTKAAQQAQQVAQQAQQAAEQAAKATQQYQARTVQTNIPSAVPIDKYTEQLNEAIKKYQSAFTNEKFNLSGFQVIHNELDDSYRAAVQFNNALGETTNVMFRLQDVLDENGKKIDSEWVTSGQKFSASFKEAGKDVENTLDIIQKKTNELQTAYSKAFDKNAARTLAFEEGDIKNKAFAQPVIDQYEKIQTTLNSIKFDAINNGIAATKDQIRDLSGDFAKLYSTIAEQKNARWTSTNFKESDTISFVERAKNKMVELSNVLKDDGVYDKFQAKISNLFTTLNNIKSGDASTGDFLNQFRNLKQEISTFESSIKGKGIMAAFEISEDQLLKIKSLGKILNGQENTQGIENLKQKLADLGKAYEDLQSKMQAKGISRDRLNGLEAERSSLDKELQSINSMINNLGNDSWVKSQNASIADMKAKVAEYRDEISKTIQLTPELGEKLNALSQAMNESGKVDVTNWKDYANTFKELKADIEQFKSTVQGQASQMEFGINTNQIQQIEETMNRLKSFQIQQLEEAMNGLNSLNSQNLSAGVEGLKQNLQDLASEYQNLMSQLQNPNLTQDQFNVIAQQVQELDEQLKRLSKEAATFGDQNSLDKFTSSITTLKLNLQNLENQYSQLIAKNPELAAKIEDVKQRLENLRPGQIPAITKDISNLAKELGLASGQSAGLRGALQDAFGGFGTYLARFTSSYYIITKTIQGIKSMVNSVKEVDTSLVELQKVTNLTGTSLSQFTEKAYQAGANLGRTGQEVIDATTTFSRAGYDLQEAAQLAQSALVMTNVGVDIPNIESAASDMISILKAFDVQAEESMGVIDKLYNVANNEPLDFGNLTQMLVTAGGTLAQTGTTLEQTMGLLTGAFATMRDPSVSNG